MTKLFHFLIALLITTLVGCAGTDKSPNTDDFATVDLNAIDSGEKVQPLISVNRLDSLKGEEKSGEAKKVVGLVFGPGINRTIGYVPLLKSLTTEGVPFHVVMGSGMGAVFAAYVAAGETHNKIEWDFYKLVKELKGLKPYSDEWLEVVDQKILEKFKGKKIQELKKLLIIPLYDTQKDELTYFYRGDLYLALKYNLQLVTSEEGQKFLTSLKGSPYGITELDKFGVDNWFGFDVLGDELSFDKIGDDYLIGVLGKLISTREVASKDYDGFFQLPMSDMPLDGVDDIPRFMKYSQNRSSEITKEVINILKN